MIKKLLALVFIISSHSFINASNEKLLEIASTNPRLEELKIIESYPYSEGEKLDNDSEFTKKQDKVREYNSKIMYTEEELKYSEEIKKISMEEFDNALVEKNKQTIPIKPIFDEKVEKIYRNNINVENSENIKKEEIKTIQKQGIIEKPQNEEKVIKIEKTKPSIEKVVEIKKEKTSPIPLNSSSYEKIVIEIDSITNTMNVKAKINDNFENIGKYRVSTGKDDVKKPFGEGKISQISLNPVWYPTATTIKSFKKRGINLPSVIPPGHKFNYMGSAKINLTHEVDGKNTFRIHGTLDERTIGTNESAGCIRMKNKEVLQLATFLNEFANKKSLNDVKVILK